jgi:putative hydrolase
MAGAPGDPIDPSEEFGFGPDAPLFRELQRVLSSSTGPVNWELARQVGVATAGWSPEDGGAPQAGASSVATDADRRALIETVRMAEITVADLTSLPMPADLVEARAIGRGEWVEANIRDLRELLDPVAAKLASAMESMGGAEGMGGFDAPGGLPFGLPGMSGGEDRPPIGFGADLDRPDSSVERPGDEADDSLGPQAHMFQQLMGTLAPLMMGAQVGTVLGSLAQRVLGQFDLALPRPPGPLLFVWPNITALERDWSLPTAEFRAYVALHEVVHRFEFAQPWVRPHVLSLVRDLIEHADVDISGLQRTLEDLDPSNPEAMQAALQGAGNMFGQTSDPEQRLRVARLQAFMAAAEGYGDHVMKTIGRRMLPAFEQIEEALRRHREGRGAEGALERLLGLEITLEQYRLGEEFCRFAVEATDEATLSRMWGSADSLPSMPELEEPTLWLSRTV